MKFRELKIGFYTPLKDVPSHERLEEAYKQIQSRFKVEKIFDWFRPREEPYTGTSTNWVVVAKEIANGLLGKACQADKKTITCGRATYRSPFGSGPPSDREIQIIRDALHQWVPGPDPDPKTTKAIDMDAYIKAINAALQQIIDIRSHDNDPLIHCEFINGKWVDTVEFLLDEWSGPDPSSWYVINAADKVIFTASISYDCPAEKY